MSAPSPAQEGLARAVLGIAALALAYYGTGQLALLMAVPPGHATAIWPPAGLALGALLLGGLRLWPGVLLASAALNLTVTPTPEGVDVVTKAASAFAIGGGSALQSVAGAVLVRRLLGWPLELLHGREIALFLLLGGPVSCLISPTIGVGALVLTGVIPAGAAADSWWTWWVGDTVGAATVAPLLFVGFGLPREVWRRRALSVALPLGLVLVMVVVLFVRILGLQRDAVAGAFDAFVDEAAAAARAPLENGGRLLRSLAAMVQLMPSAVDEAVFTAVAGRTLAATPGLRAVSWNPRVPQADRAAFPLRIVERDGTGRLVPAGVRPDYVPVLHIVPAAENAPAKGFDVASEPVRREALLRSCASGDLAATGPIRLVQDPGAADGVLVFFPVAAESGAGGPCAGIRGFLVAVLQVSDVMAAALADRAHPHVTLTLVDASPDAERALWTTAPGPPAAGAPEGGLVTERRVEFGGRAWVLRAAASGAFLHAAGADRPWLALASGMALTSVLVGILLGVSGLGVTIERMGREREAALADANAALRREIAEREEAERKVRTMDAELQQMQKMEALGNVAGGVAHDFNNLLTVILAGCQMLADRLPPEDEGRLELDDIRRAALNASTLTRQLLAFSRKQVLAPELVDLNAVVAGLHGMLRRVVEAHVDIVVEPADGEAPVVVDAAQLQHALVNLVVNARDAMPAGGRVTIRVSRQARPAAADAPGPAGAPPGEYIRLDVVDTGEGIPAEIRSRVFEPFFTTKPRGRGTGLGLSMVYGFVTQSGGAIDVSSAEGVGTTFSLYLPAATLPFVRPVEHARLDRDALAGSGTVLVVEDDDGLRALDERILRRYGYEVLAARSGAEARRLAAGAPGGIDLILADVVMPDETGPALVEALRAQHPAAKLLFVSGYAGDVATARYALPAGAAFLQKPYTPETLARAIRSLLR